MPSPSRRSGGSAAAETLAACRAVARFLHRPSSTLEAVALARKACDGDDPLGCSVLGAILAQPAGGGKDASLARTALEKACDAGEPSGCRELASLLTATGAKEAAAARGLDRRAVQLWATQCDTGSATACFEAARAYWSGRVVERDFERAPVLYKKSCRDGVADSCEELGETYDTPFYRRALVLRRKGCDEGDAESCHALARQYDFGTGVAEDEPLAALFYLKACKGGLVESCERVTHGTGCAFEPDECDRKCPSRDARCSGPCTTLAPSCRRTTAARWRSPRRLARGPIRWDARSLE